MRLGFADRENVTGMVAAAKGVLVAGRSGDDAVALGFAPEALVLWWSRQASPGLRRGNRGGVGLVAGDSQYATAWASDDAADPARARHWRSEHAVLGYASAEAEHAELIARVRVADGGFRLVYDERPATCWLVHFLALGGDALAHTAVVRFGAGPGRRAVEGVGFRPDCLIAVPAWVPANETSRDGVVAGIGAATARFQASASYTACDNVSPSAVRGSQRTDAFATLPLPRGEASGSAVLRSFDDDGFTYEWDGPAAPGADLVALALGGGRYRLSTSLSPVGRSASQRLRLGFRASAVLAFSWGLSPSSATRDIGRFALGAASPSATGCLSWGDANRRSRPSLTQVRSRDDVLLEIIDTRGEGRHALARLDSFRARSLALSWVVKDATPRQVVYLAIGSNREPGARTWWRGRRR